MPNIPATVSAWIRFTPAMFRERKIRSGIRPWSLTRSRGKPFVDGVSRPSIPAGITRLLVSDEASQLGNLQWSRLSAVSHVTWFGLRSALMLDHGTTNLATGLTTVQVGAHSSAVSVQALCILRALRQAATARFALMGWQDDEWKTACRVAEEHELVLLQVYEAGQP